MSLGAPIAIAVLAALVLSACESSQSRSARLRSEAGSQPVEKGLSIGAANPDVRVEDTTIINDEEAGRSAAVVTVRNTSGRLLAALPLVFTVTGADGGKLFTNNLPGSSPDLVTVPSLAAGDTLSWVDDAIVGVTGGRAVDARVGAPAKTAAATSAPRLRISGVRLERDPIDGVTAEGRIENRSATVQERLVIFATARRAKKIVAAGRAVVPSVKARATEKFVVFFVGDPTGAKLELEAPAVNLATGT